MRYILGHHQTEMFPEASTDGTPLFGLTPEPEPKREPMLELIAVSTKYSDDSEVMFRRWYVRADRRVEDEEIPFLLQIVGLYPTWEAMGFVGSIPMIKQVGKRIVIGQSVQQCI